VWRDASAVEHGMSLLTEVYGCSYCERFGQYHFERPPSIEGGGFYKFPATIGATGPAPLLFIGINPRRSSSNQLLCDTAMSSIAAFGLLAANREPDIATKDDARYIRRYRAGDPVRFGREPHYRQHLSIVEGAWEDTNTRFEDHAVATELYLCSTENTQDRTLTADSQCADRFLVRTIQQVQPAAIVTLGQPPRDHIRDHFAESRPITSDTLSPYQADIEGHLALVFDVPHAGDRVPKAVRDRAVQHAISGIRRIVIEKQEPEFVPLGELFPPRSRGRGATSAGWPADPATVAEAKKRLGDGRPFTDGAIFPIYDEARPGYRPAYRAYLAAWAIREALGYDKSVVRISTKRVAGGYVFTIIPR
jgi:hypothetical protein